MNRIDKLVNRAFPDELRNVEPIAVDEDAIFAHTLEKLGLNAQSPLAEPKPLKQSQRGRREAKLVEVPQTEVKHRWVEWTGWAVAACLVIAFAVSWGPWLMSNLGFGTRDPGPAEKGPQTYSPPVPRPWRAEESAKKSPQHLSHRSIRLPRTSLRLLRRWRGSPVKSMWRIF